MTAEMLHRQTLARAVEVSGIGLHSGRAVTMRLVPAEAGAGRVFVRTDVDVEIPATLDALGPSFYATVLVQGEHRVATVEHLLSALSALQIDDLRIELDADEVPILDGSALPFFELIRDAGTQMLHAERDYMIVTRPIVLQRDDKRIAVYPGSEYRVTYAIDFDHPELGYQELTASVWNPDHFRHKLAAARTFTFERDVETLRQAGLALGGSLDNAIVIGQDGILNDGLRFPDEFVRHKMLDLTGDLALLPHPLLGHVVAYRAGHDMHTQLAELIRRRDGHWYLGRWSGAAADPATAVP